MGKHKVKKGETLSKIAKNYGLTLLELLDLNGISADKANHITIGLELVTNKNVGLPDFSKPFKLNNFTPYTSSTVEAVVPYTSRNKEENDTILLQRQLLSKGYDLGKSGVDGKMGRATNAALLQAIADGFRYENGMLVKDVPKKSRSSVPMYGVHPMFGFTIPLAKVLLEKVLLNPKNNKGYAFYVSYPEHTISTKGTGYEFLGRSLPIIKGHAASIIVDENGNATYHTYGRYSDGGSYKMWNLPRVNKDETHEAYLKRVRPKLEYAATNEPVNATHVPNVNAAKSRDYYKSKPQTNKYSITKGITCAGEACRGIDAGTGVDSSRWFDWLVPDTPENVRSLNYDGNETYNF